MRRLIHLLVLLAFIFSCGGQWAVLQCVAWVTMIHDYSQVVPVGEAVSMTFSGKYPCALCKIIAERKQSGNSKALSLEKYEKKSIPSLAVAALSTPISAPIEYPDFRSSLQSRSEAPPTPPPRLLLS